MRRYEVGVGGVHLRYFANHPVGERGELMDDRLCEQPTAAKLGEESLHPETLIYLKTTLFLGEVKAPVLIGPIRAGSAEAVRRFLYDSVDSNGRVSYSNHLGAEFSDVVYSALEFPIFNI